MLVTGPSGFIGSQVVRGLVADGHDVIALARPQSSLERLADVEGRFAVKRWEPEDGTLAGALGSWRPDGCIHLAWYAVPGKYLDAPQNVDSMVYAIRLLDELARAGCGHVVMTGTCAEYDADTGYLREDSPTRPSTLYAAAKLATGLVCGQRASQVGVGFSWARVFYLYGPHEDSRRMVPSLIRALLEGVEFPATAGDQVRDYLHVEDVAAALCKIALNGVGGTYNVCSGEPITVRRFMMEVARTVGRPELVRFGALAPGGWQPAFVCGDNERLRSIGWEPGHTLNEGIADTVAWWKDQLKATAS